MKCSKCGENKSVRKEVYEKRLKVTGLTRDQLDASYVCQKCRKLFNINMIGLPKNMSDLDNPIKNIPLENLINKANGINIISDDTKHTDVNDLIKGMSPFEMSRWLALAEGVNIIYDKCLDKGIDFDKIEVKPLALQKYLEGTCDTICKKILNEQNEEEI